MTSWLPEGTEEWAGRPIARTVDCAAARQRVHVTGVVLSVAVRRHAARGALHREWNDNARHASLEAAFDDGTGLLLLRWAGREAIPGLAVGVTLTVEGVVLEEGESRVVLNPLYRFG